MPFLLLCSILRGSRSEKALEALAEKVRVLIAAHYAYLLYAKVGGEEQLAR
jgi:hypothetical protein